MTQLSVTKIGLYFVGAVVICVIGLVIVGLTGLLPRDNFETMREEAICNFSPDPDFLDCLENKFPEGSSVNDVFRELHSNSFVRQSTNLRDNLHCDWFEIIYNSLSTSQYIIHVCYEDGSLVRFEAGPPFRNLGS